MISNVKGTGDAAVNNPGMVATEITYIGEWDFTQYRRNAPFLMKI